MMLLWYIVECNLVHPCGNLTRTIGQSHPSCKARTDEAFTIHQIAIVVRLQGASKMSISSMDATAAFALGDVGGNRFRNAWRH